MIHYTDLSPSLKALANKTEPTEWVDSTAVAQPVQGRAGVYGVTRGDTRTKINCLSARTHLAPS